MKTTSATINGFFISCCLLAAACNNGAGGNGGDSTLGNSMGDSIGSKMENAASGIKNDVTNLVKPNEDSSFIVKAITGNNEEIILINAGLQQGASSQLKSDARKMLGDHTKLKTQLESYATKNGYPVPQSDKGKSTNDLEKVNKNSKGAEWDKAWAGMMADDHKGDIDDYEKGEKNVTDSSLHTIITATLPVLKSHLMHAEELQKAIK